jgi:rhodanese-related sulfurtransferase
MTKNIFKFAWLFVLAVLIGFTSCSEDDDDDDDDVTPIVEAEVLIDHLETANPVNTFPVMIKSTDVYTGVTGGADQYIIDIRAAADYAEGHIEGAVNVAAGDVIAHYEENNLADKETVVLVCYSGQSAAWVNGLMHSLGHTNCKDMKYGMSSWNAATSGSWVNNTSNTYSALMVQEATAKAEAGELPTLSTGKTTAAEILDARVAVVVGEGFSGAAVASSAIFDNPDDYYIVNYWSQTDYDWGHAPGAIQYTPKESLTSDTFLKTLPTDKTIAVYCYTGQTSAHVAAYLRILGYDAKSVKFGVNGMSHDTMPGTVFNAETDVHDYPLVTSK